MKITEHKFSLSYHHCLVLIVNPWNLASFEAIRVTHF
jgi:hypothetical protein